MRRVKMIVMIALVIIGAQVWLHVGTGIAEEMPHMKAMQLTYETIAAAYQHGYDHGECPDKIAQNLQLRIICEEGIADKEAGTPPNVQQASFVYCEHLAFIAFQEKNYDEMYKWWKIAAEAGRTQAQFVLGGMLRDGIGGKKDCQNAIKWLTKASDSGYGQAQYELGYMYYYGDCVAQDLPRAVDLNNKAMDNGVAQAYTHMGWMLANGEVYAKNIVGAYVFWRVASELGDKHAAELLEKHNFTPEQRMEGEKKIEELLKAQ